ncbi:MAG: hypothetical protein ACRDYE_00445 [Acidimicrobiales bacterium]
MEPPTAMTLPSPVRHAGTATSRRGTTSMRALAALGAGLLAGLVGSLVLPVGTGVAPGAAAAGPATSAAGPATAAPRTAPTSAYWLVASDGGIFSFGGAPFYGSAGSIPLNQPVVGMAATPNSAGYWLVAADGGVFTYGNAPFYGSTGNLRLNRPVVGMAAAPDGSGYWMVASDGGVFTFGNVAFHGSMGGQRLNQPVVGMAATPDGGGYWLVAADGGIFSFGDAQFYGSTGGIHLNRPIVGMTPTPSGHGYWFTASDGGVFSFGDAGFYGSLGSVPQGRPVVAMATSGDGGGYWFTNNNGLVSAFGDATYWGSAPQVLNRPVVGMAQAAGNGSFTGSSYPSGSFGYDLSNFQCGGLPPAPHTIGVVEVVGYSKGRVNPCLTAEAAWAAGGLNLYAFLTFGLDPTSGDPSCLTMESPPACNFGFDTAMDAFQKAAAAGVNTAVPWWLDVESDPSWSGDLAANKSLVQGAIDGLHFEGLNSVGIYASPGVWNGIVGNYAPAVPYWAASWGVDPANTCANVRSMFAGPLPAGPVQMVQYSSPSFSLALGGTSTGFDDDYAC